MERFLAGDWGRGLLLEYVFLEVVTVLLIRRGLATSTAVAEILLQAEELDFAPCSDFFADTVETFSRQQGTAFSFTDAAIVTLARKHAQGCVATFDSEFRKLPDLRVIPE